MAETMTEQQPQTGTATAEGGDFAALLLQEFKPKTERAREAVETAVRTLAEHALEKTDLISNDAIKSIESIIVDSDHRAKGSYTIHGAPDRTAIATR